MREQALCTPFFKDKATTNAVLTVIVRYNRGIDAAESIEYSSAKYNVNADDVAMYWEAVKKDGRWIKQ